MAAPNHVDQPPPAAVSPAAGHDPRDALARDDDPTQLLTQLFAGATLGPPPVDAPNHHSDHPPPAGTAAGASASPTTTTDPDPAAVVNVASSSDGDGALITRALTALMAKPPLPRISAARMRMMSIAQATTAAKAAAAASVPPTAGGRDDPDVSSFYLRRILAELVGGGGDGGAGADLGATRPAASAPTSSRLAALRAAEAAAAAPGLSIPLDLAWIRAHHSAPPERQQWPAGGHAGRVARRQRFRVPTDYLRAGQDSLDRRRRRTLVRSCIRRVIFVREDRAGERRISTMMSRLTPLTSVGALAGDAVAAAASEYAAASTSSTVDAGLAEQLDKMELPFED